MVSSSFFAASGWRAVLAAPAATFFTVAVSAPGIAVSCQINFRPPVSTPAFVHDRIAPAASPGAAWRAIWFAVPKFIVDFARLRLLNGPRFNAVVLSHEPLRRQFGKEILFGNDAVRFV
jgi:hypothetical protein